MSPAQSTPLNSDISSLLDQLQERWLEVVRERNELRAALTEIAAFADTGANEILQRTGSYSGFDEPGAVQTAREALNDQKGPSA